MELLYNKKHVKRDTYTYLINQGGEFLVRESGPVTIIFENGKFISANFPFCGNYTRNCWRILAAIADEIDKIEQQEMLDGQSSI